MPPQPSYPQPYDDVVDEEFFISIEEQKELDRLVASNVPQGAGAVAAADDSVPARMVYQRSVEMPHADAMDRSDTCSSIAAAMANMTMGPSDRAL